MWRWSGQTASSVSGRPAHIGHELLLRVAAEFPEFSLKVMKNLSGKLDRSVAQLKEVKHLFD